MNKDMEKYIEKYKEIADAVQLKEVFWLNPDKKNISQVQITEVSEDQIEDAEARLKRFAAYLCAAFPETKENDGILESPLRKILKMQECLNTQFGADIKGELYLKMDSHLPISGSIKARGGIYEVLKHAETLAIEHNLLKETDNYAMFADEKFRKFFSQYTIQVGSTGNLGMSIGIMSAKLGFEVIVHMSADAKQWKKDLLRSRGATVIEYQSDYCVAVEQGRKESIENPNSYFVDDENSVDLFLGYSVAAKRLKQQLYEQSIVINENKPLFVYLPCGIGGAPGGVAYGLKQVFGDHVHCFFTEPTEACCMLLGVATGLHDKVCVQDFDISGKTEADGLAVGRPSAFVGRVIAPYLSGIATIADNKLYQLMDSLKKTEDIFIEPSACASFAGLLKNDKLNQYIKCNGLESVAHNAIHIAWATGGSMVPEYMIEEYLSKVSK